MDDPITHSSMTRYSLSLLSNISVRPTILGCLSLRIKNTITEKEVKDNLNFMRVDEEQTHIPVFNTMNLKLS